MRVGRAWKVLVCRMPSEPARHRIGLWRDLRRAGAIPLAPSVWALPDVPAVTDLMARAQRHADAAGGEVLVLDAHGHDEAAAERLEHAYRDARADEWAEFRADCDKYLAELDKEERLAKFTLAELEEEEQSMDRLRRWYRDLRARDLLPGTATETAEQHLKHCDRRFEHYAEQVYRTLGMTTQDPPAMT